MLAIKYSFFAGISMCCNLFVQYLVFAIYGGLFVFYLSILAGTIVGLLSKYVLDKKYIFYYQSQNKTDDAKKFFLYLCMGIITTLIFWGTEIAFDQIFNNTYAKYMGAIVGLTMGYTIKFFLDKKYVFKDQKA